VLLTVAIAQLTSMLRLVVEVYTVELAAALNCPADNFFLAGFPGWLNRIRGDLREANPQYLEAVRL
jgi:hypothetical protein